VALLLGEHEDKVLELAAVLEEKKNISGEEVAEIMGSAPGSRTMREPRGWQAISDEIASDRQRDALTKAGREVAAKSPGNGQVAPATPVEAESGQGD
jgi:hypothetical protein